MIASHVIANTLLARQSTARSVVGAGVFAMVSPVAAILDAKCESDRCGSYLPFAGKGIEAGPQGNAGS